MIFMHTMPDTMPDGIELIELLSIPVQIRELAASVREIRDLKDQFGRLSLSDQNAPENTSDPKLDKRRKGKQVLYEKSAAKGKRKRKVVVDEDPAHPAEFQLEPFDLNEYPIENATTTVHDMYAPENAKAPATSGVKKQANRKKAVVNQKSADSDYDSSRTISYLPTQSMNLNHRRCEEVADKGSKIKSILKKTSQISFPNGVTGDATRIPLAKRKKVAFDLDGDDKNKKKNKNKKRTARKANESPKLNEAEPSNRKGCNGPCASKIAVRQAGTSKPGKHRTKRLKSSHDEIVKEVKRKRDAVGGCEPSGSDSVVVGAGKVKRSGEMLRARELRKETLVCTVNLNPAEFIPEIAKMFLR